MVEAPDCEFILDQHIFVRRAPPPPLSHLAHLNFANGGLLQEDPMASVASSSSGYGPFDSDGPDRNGPLHADPIEGETMVRVCKSCVRLSIAR